MRRQNYGPPDTERDVASHHQSVPPPLSVLVERSLSLPVSLPCAHTHTQPELASGTHPVEHEKKMKRAAGLAFRGKRPLLLHPGLPKDTHSRWEGGGFSAGAAEPQQESQQRMDLHQTSRLLKGNEIVIPVISV